MKPRDRKIYVIKHRYYFLHAHLNIMKNLFAKVERTSYFIYSVTTLQSCQKLVLRFIKNFSDTSSFKTFLIFPFLIKHQKLNRAENIWVFFSFKEAQGNWFLKFDTTHNFIHYWLVTWWYVYCGYYCERNYNERVRKLPLRTFRLQIQLCLLFLWLVVLTC